MLTGNTLSQLVPFLIAPILTRLFSPEEFAVLANFMAIVTVIGIVASGRLELAIPLPQHKEKAQDIVFTGTVITMGLGLLSILIPLFADQISDLYKDELLGSYLWMVPLSVISYGLLGIANNWNLRNEKFRSLSIGKVSQSVVNNGLAALLGYIGWGINGLIIAWLISQYVNILILLFSVERKVSRKDFGIITIKTTLKEYKDFPLINSLHAFTDIFVTQFLLFWLISSYFGQTELGLFAMMHKYVRAPIVLVSNSVSQLFYVEAGKALNNSQSLLPIIRKTIKTTILFGIPFTVILFIYGPQLFKWYLGAPWEEAGYYARNITPMLFLSFIMSPISALPILMNKQKGAFLFSLFGYAISLAALLIGMYFGFTFGQSLWLYAGGFCIYYVSAWFWYMSLIKKRNEGSN